MAGTSEQRIDGRRARHAHRRPELLEAATDYVFEHGLTDLSIRPLAAELGISHRTLLHHFGSKQQLLAEILHELRKRDHRLIAAESERVNLDNEDPIGVAWRRMSSPPYDKYWRCFFEAYGIALKDPDRYRVFLEGIVSEWLEAIEPLLVEAGCEPSRATPLASLLLASFRGLFLDLLATRQRARVDRAAADLVAATRWLIATSTDT